MVALHILIEIVNALKGGVATADTLSVLNEIEQAVVTNDLNSVVNGAVNMIVGKLLEVASVHSDGNADNDRQKHDDTDQRNEYIFLFHNEFISLSDNFRSVSILQQFILYTFICDLSRVATKSVTP